MDTKICKKCGEDKSVDDFYKHKASCKACVLAHNQEYKKTNNKAVSKTAKAWYKKTKIGRRAHKAQYYKNRRKTDVIFNIKTSVSRLIRTSISRCGFKKQSKTNLILGCSYEELKIYLESKFESWMNWDNKGLYNGEPNYGWDIDHIIPMAMAKTKDDVVKLNHCTNLQPLCSKVNRDLKRDK